MRALDLHCPKLGEIEEAWMVGDRCQSEVSGKEGEITQHNSRHTYIWWDKDKAMGLAPVQYSASDLEVMRICRK
jgi:hypothetical protein